MSSFTAETDGDFGQGESPVETISRPVQARSRLFARLLAALHETRQLARLVVAIRDYRRAMLELDALADRDLLDMGIDRRDIARISWREACRSSGLDAPDAQAATPHAALPLSPAALR